MAAMWRAHTELSPPVHGAPMGGTHTKVAFDQLQRVHGGEQPSCTVETLEAAHGRMGRVPAALQNKVA
jgi:hypothetical protein